ncbi:MAG TPA: nucleotide exchange factor GrpE [Solirubrobacterales bacterium]|nr:nucleotide exchange factor GrpE [Solirubrobacterales bacterium]
MTPSQDELRDEGARPAGPAAGPAGPVTAGDPPPPATTQEGVPPTAPPAGEAEQVEQDFDALLADANQQKEEYLELARRTKADFENFRKRVASDIQAAQSRGKIEVAREVIDAVDNLERALEAADGSGEELRTGVEMVLGGLRETLKRNGVEVVDPKGDKFDPTKHEALSTQPVEGTESGLVVEVLQKGYALGDQLVRPARVVVSS